MVGEDYLDLVVAGVGPAVVLDGFTRGPYRALTGDVRIEPGLVIENADPDDAVGVVGQCGTRTRREGNCSRPRLHGHSHGIFLPFSPRWLIFS